MAFMKKILLIPLLFSIQIIHPQTSHARRINQPLSDEQKAINRENELRQTPLKIGADCRPSSTLTKFHLQTLNEAQIKYFWLGQKYAIQRSYREELMSQNNFRRNQLADRRITEMERRRDEQNLIASGIKPTRDLQLERLSKENDGLMANIELELAQSNRAWAIRCFRYADERSK